jgi:condensation domain-containing protein
MTQTHSAPATFGQLSVLRSLAKLGDAGQHHANLAQLCRLPAGCTFTDVEAAWSHVVRHNDSLRTSFDLSGDRPMQIVHPHRPARLAEVRIDDDGTSSALASARMLAATSFDLTSGRPWRAFVGTGADGTPAFLGFAVHHAAADHAGCLSIDEQLQSALRAHDIPAPEQPMELAQEQQDNADRYGRALDFWAERWRSFPPEERAGSDASPRSRAHLYSRDAMAATVQAAAELKVSMQAVVLAITSLVLSKMLGRDGLTLGLMAANRLNPRWAMTVTSMNQLAPCQISADPAATPTALVRLAYLTGLKAYMNGQYDVDQLRSRLIAERIAYPDPVTFDSYFNFLGTAGETPADDETVAHSVELRPLPRRVGPAMNMSIATGEGMHIVVRASRDYLEPERLGLAAASIEAGLVSLIADRPATVADIRTDPLREVVVR